MRFARVCSHELYVPDNVAEWDAVAQDSPWEKVRFDSMLTNLTYGDVLYDVGSEHGWMSAIYAQTVGGENMVLVEPSPDFWPNIRGCWSWNGLGVPLATADAFCSAKTQRPRLHMAAWPDSSEGPECPAMAYRHLNNHTEMVPTVTIDWLSKKTGIPPKGITIDVEGAELGVLQGAKYVLENDRPNVWVSIHPDLMIKDFGTTPEEIYAYMEGLGYRRKHLGNDHEQHNYFWPAEWGNR
jgi:FkbM family methyltransferase